MTIGDIVPGSFRLVEAVTSCNISGRVYGVPIRPTGDSGDMCPFGDMISNGSSVPNRSFVGIGNTIPNTANRCNAANADGVAYPEF